MKALRKFVHLSLTVAFLLASVGFRMNTELCQMEQGGMSPASKSSCCCDPSGGGHQAPDKACQDMTCLLQVAYSAYPASSTSTEQTDRLKQEPVAYTNFTACIRPTLLEEMPHFTLPPPVSGRLLGIFHQTFII